MPNWCCTTYKCVGEPKEVGALNDILKYMDGMDKPLLPSDFGTMWLGNLVHILGESWEKVGCRGSVTGFRMEEGVLVIDMETAWGELSDVRHLIERKYPSVKVYYQAEEPGCDYFYMNDRSGEYFPDKYYIEHDDGCGYFETFEDVLKYVSGVIGKVKSKNLEALQKEVDEWLSKNKKPDDRYFNIYEFKLSED